MGKPRVVTHFNRAFEHCCHHSRGKAVIEKIVKTLKQNQGDEGSEMTRVQAQKHLILQGGITLGGTLNQDVSKVCIPKSRNNLLLRRNE